MGYLPLLLSLIINSASAAELLFLDLGDIPEEERLVQELQLGMTDVEIAPVRDDFTTLPMNQQLAAARELAHTIPAVAWLEVTPKTLLVQLAFLTTDRADLQVVEVPRTQGAISRLALTLRELLLEAPELASALPATVTAPTKAPEQSPTWGLRSAIGLTVPVNYTNAGGLRPRLDLRLTRTYPVGEFGLGGGFEAGLQDKHRRINGRFVAHLGPLYLGAGADITTLEWTQWVQPRLEIGVSPSLPRHVFAEFILRGTFLRDQITKEESTLYDSGWVEFALQFGFVRQISSSSEHD